MTAMSIPIRVAERAEESSARYGIYVGSSQTSVGTTVIIGGSVPAMYRFVPASEQWLWADHRALSAVYQGLADAQVGRVSGWSSFIEYVNDND